MKIHTPEIDTLNAATLKLWLAQVGDEYLQGTADPARLLNRARLAWRMHGRSDEWITQRMTGQATQDKPTTNMSESALIFAALAELSTQQIEDCVEAISVVDHQASAEKGSRIAAQARIELERQTGKPIVTDLSHVIPVAKNKMRPIKANALK